MSGEVADVISHADLTCSSTKLEREKAESYLTNLCLQNGEQNLLFKWVEDKFQAINSWEDAFGALLISKIIITKATDVCTRNFHLLAKEKALLYQTHDEFRVRIMAGELMGVLCEKFSSEFAKEFMTAIKAGIMSNLLRQSDDNERKSTQEAILHDTAGWRHLETWMKCLQFVIKGAGVAQYEIELDDELFNLLFTSVKHTNRFVRETGYDLFTSFVENNQCINSGKATPDKTVECFLRIVRQFADGLADNWSQVRMAASRAARSLFLSTWPSNIDKDEVHAIILPPMALNRYYSAEGVRIYSQETWELVTDGQGKELIKTNIQATLDFYISQTEADNHSVREAACAAIAEAGCKLDSDLLVKHLPKLLEALEVCFGDDSWPVRDASCIALGNLVSSFPIATRSCLTSHQNEEPVVNAEEKAVSDLCEDKFLHNLSDSIFSVRQGAAQAISKVLGATLLLDKDSSTDETIKQKNAELRTRYMEYIKKQLIGIAKQPSESKGTLTERVEGQNPGASVAISNVRRTIVDPHDIRHTDQQMYSCGSLAPKMRKGVKGGGCHDGLFQREAEPWERASGAVSLLSALVANPDTREIFPDDIVQNQLADAAMRTHYPHYVYFLENVCLFVHTAVRNFEKNRFKRYLDNLLPVLGIAIDSELPLTKCAAEDAVSAIAQKIGPSILRGRIEMHFDAQRLTGLLQVLP